MDKTTIATSSAVVESSHQLLNLLYASVHDGSCRRDFMRELSRHLAIDIAHIHLYHLSEGSMLRYSEGSDKPLFEPATSAQPSFHSAAVARYSTGSGELIFHTLADNQLGIAWAQAASLVHLIGRPRFATTTAELGPRHGQLLSYLLPHFGCVHTLFLRQQAQLPRLNAIRKIHAILPLPLLICRLEDGLLAPNPCALDMLNKVAATTRSDRSVVPLHRQNFPWKLRREGRMLGLRRAGSDVQIPAISLHTLPVGSRLHYEVYLLAGTGPVGRVEENLLKDIFGFSAGEARLCACALEGKNPAEMAATLEISINTVKARLKSIYRRLEVNSVAQLAVRLYFHPVYWAAQQRAPLLNQEVVFDVGQAKELTGG